MLISRGSMQLYYGIKVRHWGEGLGPYMGLGSIAMSFVSVTCGVLLLVHPLAGISYLTFVLAGYLIITGGFDLLHSFELRFVSAWPLVSLSGLISVLFGVLIWQQWPLSGSWAIGVAVGASLIVSGLSLSGTGIIEIRCILVLFKINLPGIYSWKPLVRSYQSSVRLTLSVLLYHVLYSLCLLY